MDSGLVPGALTTAMAMAAVGIEWSHVCMWTCRTRLEAARASPGDQDALEYVVTGAVY